MTELMLIPAFWHPAYVARQRNILKRWLLHIQFVNSTWEKGCQYNMWLLSMLSFCAVLEALQTFGLGESSTATYTNPVLNSTGADP
jgi:hypothetical protein